MTERSDTHPLTTDLDSRVRVAAFAFLADQVEARGEVLPRDLLAEGFIFEGQRVPLMGPQGIFKPSLLDVPLSLTTVPVVEGRPRPYEDEIDPDGLLIYRYRGTDPEHRDNLGLRLAMARKAPLIYFDGVVPGQYLASWPVFIVGDDPAGLSFRVDVDSRRALGPISEPETVAEARRQYVISTVRHRVHQLQFRYRVLKAYREHCAVCRLRHLELLDAAHILPDGHPRGEPVVANGLALCKLHHAAFDRHILGVRPDLVIEIRDDILREEDGPMLRHGLQGFQAPGSQFPVPRASSLTPTSSPNATSCSGRRADVSTSPFLVRPSSEWVACNPLAFAIRDLYQVTRGHTLIVPLRPIATWFEATHEERLAMSTCWT